MASFSLCSSLHLVGKGLVVVVCSLSLSQVLSSFNYMIYVHAYDMLLCTCFLYFSIDLKFISFNVYLLTG